MNRDAEKKKITISICGNPNCGKTTIFNDLTGSMQHVGNWPGVTVERKTGRLKHKGYEFIVEDLPGTYSLSDATPEELIARDFIINSRPDVLLNVVDATSLERNLYLYTQLIDFGLKVILVFNMSDEMKEKGISVNTELLSKLLGAPIVFTVGHKGEGIAELKDKIIEVYEGGLPPEHVNVDFGKEMNAEIERLAALIEKHPKLVSDGHPSKWIAMKLLEQDAHVAKGVVERDPEADYILTEAESSTAFIETFLNEDSIISYIADRRYGFIRGALKETVTVEALGKKNLSERVDATLMHRVFGLPLMLFFMWVTFNATFTIGQYPMDWIEGGVEWLVEFLGGVLPEGVFASLIAEGVVSGMGSVLVFLPNILILFFFISLMEDTGYMARIAFITDKVMHLVGLHGKSFIPMIMAFGCNVPAIMAARTLESRRDRLLTILINPLIICSARLPVMILIAGAFFREKAGNVIFGLYLFSFVMALISAYILSKTAFRGLSAPFVMELPPYRLPTARGVFLHSWHRGKTFLKKMTTVILLGSVIIWALNNLYVSAPAPQEGISATDIAEGEGRESYLERMGKMVSPVFAPLGFDWKDTAALIAGFFAKEIVVSAYGVLYAADEESEALSEALRKSGKSGAQGLALLIFVLIYTPCLATVIAVRKETGSRAWTAFSVVYQLVLAWVLAFMAVSLF